MIDVYKLAAEILAESYTPKIINSKKLKWKRDNEKNGAARQRKYRMSHLEKCKQKSRLYDMKNKEKKLKRWRKWYYRNRDEILIKQKERRLMLKKVSECALKNSP